MKILHVFTLPGTAEAFFDGQFGYLSRCGHKITVAGGGDRFPDKEDFVKGTPFCHAACMVRREAYDTVGGYSVDTRLLRVEDYHLWFKMYACGYKGYVMTVPLYKMRDDCNAVLRRI